MEVRRSHQSYARARIKGVVRFIGQRKRGIPRGEAQFRKFVTGVTRGSEKGEKIAGRGRAALRVNKKKSRAM